MNIWKWLLSWVFASIGANEVQAGILLTTGTYTQDFNILASTGTSSVLPPEWLIAETDTNANSTYIAGTGSSTTGDTYSFGSSGSSERALGGLRSGTLVPMFGASFTNNGASTLSSIAISYTGEQWRLGALNRADRLDFQFSTNASSLTTGTWTDINVLDFTGPVSTGSTGALDGNLPMNRLLVTGSLTSLDLSVGSTVWIRWQDFEATGSDDGLAIDDFSATGSFAAVPEPSSMLLLGVASSLAAVRALRAKKNRAS